MKDSSSGIESGATSFPVEWKTKTIPDASEGKALKYATQSVEGSSPTWEDMIRGTVDKGGEVKGMLWENGDISWAAQTAEMRSGNLYGELVLAEGEGQVLLPQELAHVSIIQNPLVLGGADVIIDGHDQKSVGSLKKYLSRSIARREGIRVFTSVDGEKQQETTFAL